MDQQTMIDDLVRMLDAGAQEGVGHINVAAPAAGRYRPDARNARPHRWPAAFPPSTRVLTELKTNDLCCCSCRNGC